MTLMRRLLHVLLMSAALQAATGTAAENLVGKVAEVVSGDSVIIVTPDGQRHSVRLFAVAAPEPRQPFSGESRRGLAALVQGKRAAIEIVRMDDYGRVIGKLLTIPAHCATCAPSRDAGLIQIEAGLAWWLRDERKEQTLHDQGYYEYAEFDARTRRLGLWRDESPTPPWEWRKGKGLKAQWTPSGPQIRPSFVDTVRHNVAAIKTKPVTAGAGTGFSL